MIFMEMLRGQVILNINGGSVVIGVLRPAAFPGSCEVLRSLGLGCVAALMIGLQIWTRFYSNCLWLSVGSVLKNYSSAL